MSQTEQLPAGAGDKLWKVVSASLAGTTVEWYEFFIYGTASALVFNKLFFPEFDPLVGTLLSLSTFAIAFVARPLGGVIFGHFGDRVGRKSMLVITLTLMGLATFGIGLLPTYGAVGVAAPLLLVLLRLIQGLSLGGEYGGAILMSVEHAGQGRRGLAGGLVNTGAAWGSLLATLVFMPIAALPDDQFEAWGWRIPFLVSIVLVVLGLFIRVRLHESPEFSRLKRKGDVRRIPLKDVLARHPLLVVLMCVAYLSAGVTFYVGTVFSLSYGQEHLGVDRNVLLRIVLATSILTIVVLPVFGWISDYVDRKRIFVISALGMGVTPYLWFVMFNTKNFPLMLIGTLVMFVPYAANYGTMATFFAQVFPHAIRYTGMSIGYTLGTVVGSATAPLVATYLLAQTGGWPAIAGYMSAVSIISFVAALFMFENRYDDSLPPVATGDPEALGATFR